MYILSEGQLNIWEHDEIFDGHGIQTKINIENLSNGCTLTKAYYKVDKTLDSDMKEKVKEKFITVNDIFIPNKNGFYDEDRINIIFIDVFDRIKIAYFSISDIERAIYFSYHDYLKENKCSKAEEPITSYYEGIVIANGNKRGRHFKNLYDLHQSQFDLSDFKSCAVIGYCIYVYLKTEQCQTCIGTGKDCYCEDIDFKNFCDHEMYRDFDD